jgi:transaldolase
MSLLLDSALAQDARQAMALGFITGITTNPSLMAQVNRPAEEVIAEIADICPGIVFYQLIAPTVAEREAEARRFLAMRKNIGLKIACTTENLALAHEFASEGVTVGVTAIYSVAQCYLALVEKMRAVTDAHDGPTEVLVASLKSPAEVVDAVLAGAQHVTIPLALIREMGNHLLSDQAIEEFRMASVTSRVSKA